MRQKNTGFSICFLIINSRLRSVSKNPSTIGLSIARCQATQSGIGLERFASGRNATVFCHRLRAHPGTLYAVDNSGLQAGSTVLISGVGTIGALTVLSVNAAGASQIFVAEPNPARRKFIESWGLCAGVFDPTEDVPACIREQTSRNSPAGLFGSRPRRRSHYFTRWLAQ